MNARRPYRCLSALLPVILIAGFSGPSFAAYDKKDGRYYEPVEVPGEVLDPLLGLDIKNFGVYAYRDGAWAPALFQIDERTPEGNFILTKGPEANAGEGNGKFDKQDLIVFMAREAGSKAPENELPPGADKAVAVELVDPLTKESVWIYPAWFEKGAPKTNLDPVTALIDKGGVFNLRFSTSGYDALINEREKKAVPTININKLWVFPEAGGNGKNIIDRQKVRGHISFLGGTIKVPINEKIISGGIVAYKPGPVRVLTHSYQYPLFPMGIKGPGFYIDSILGDCLTLTVITMDVPLDPGFLIHDLTLGFGMDLTPNAKGMKYYNSENPNGFTIDGKMDEAEKNQSEKKDKWRLITGPQGTQIVASNFDKKFLADGEIYSTYNDNEDDINPPENFLGDIGAAFDKLVVRSLEPGAYKIRLFGALPYDFYDPKGLNQELLQQVLTIQSSPLVIKAGDKKVENQGGLCKIVIEP